MLKAVYAYLKKEKVLLTAFVIAIFTAFLVKPDRAYLGYIDFRVLCLLFSLMAVVSGMESCGAFEAMASKLISFGKNGRVLGFLLVMLPFFASMLVTNDVSLLTFVPFTIMLLKNIGCEKEIIPVIVLQTAGANLGSMATPVGNPQNLFLYSFYDLSYSEFFSCVLPLTFISFILLMVSSIFILPKEPNTSVTKGSIKNKGRLFVYIVLFLICLLVVARILPFKIMTLLVAAAVFIMDRELFKSLDYALLLTFICFFIVSGNLGRVNAVRSFLDIFLGKSTLLTAIGASQVISNVPCAVLLSSFTDNAAELLKGVNIGGLGTPVASLASLITLKIYMSEKNADTKKFLKYFAFVNVSGLIILTLWELIF